MVERIGSGAMGVVWQARDERLERSVAIKQLLLQPGLSEQENTEARQRAMREARIAARLHNPNAIAIFDVIEHQGEPCLIMEYLPARNLAQVLSAQGSLAPQVTAALGAQVATALAAAHAAGIVHRDVKPGNILISEQGVAKIMDFGISRAVGDVTVTRTGLSAGTPAYLAPEVARGNDSNPATDVFSLGATLYHAVEGTPPFGNDSNPLALLHTVSGGAINPPQRAGKLKPLLLALLNSEPAKRPTMAQAAESLAKLASGNQVSQLTTTKDTKVALPVSDKPIAAATSHFPVHPPVALPRTHSPRKLVIAACLALVLIIGGIAAFLLMQPRGNTTGTTASTSKSNVAPTTSSATKVPTSNAGGAIDFHDAGQLVIDYYVNPMKNPASAWAKLSPALQGNFGGQDAFTGYWNQYQQVYANNAIGVTLNADGSVNVPVDVTYITGSGTTTTHKVIHVIRQNGQLLIDSDGK